MQLYELVQSMTKSERRYFRLYVKSGGNEHEPKYLSLFNVLCKVTSYDEKKIAKKGYTYHDRNLLMEKVLEALHVFDSRKSVDAEIQMLLSQVTILREKNILDELSKRLRRAKKLAIENEQLLYLIRILDVQKELAFDTGKINMYEQLREEQKRTLKNLVDEMNYADIAESTSLILLEDAKLNNTKNRERFERLVDDSVLPEPAADASVYTKINYHGIKFQYAQVINDVGQTITHAKKMIDLMDNHFFTIIKKDYSFFRVYIFMRSWQRKFDHQSINISDTKFLENVLTFSGNPALTHTTYVYYIKECISSLHKMRGEAVIQKIDNRYMANIKADYQVEISYNIAIFYGIFGEWEKSMSWIKSVLSIRRSVIYKHFQFKTRFYALIVHYERAADDLSTHVQSVHKYLKRNNHENDTEQKVLKFMEKLSQASHHKDKIDIWKNLYELLSNESDLMHNNTFPLEYFIQWCKSKIEGSTIAEVIRREREQQPEEVL